MEIFIWQTLLLMLGGFPLLQGHPTHSNQTRKDLDKLMTRTVNRPLPTAGCLFQRRCGLLSWWVFPGCNFVVEKWTLCVEFSVCSHFYYMWQCIPCQTNHFIFCLIGDSSISSIARLGCCKKWNRPRRIGFGIPSTIWQFPHFWVNCLDASRWLSESRFKMLPSGTGRTKHSAFQTLCIPFVLFRWDFFLTFSIHGIDFHYSSLYVNILFCSGLSLVCIMWNEVSTKINVRFIHLSACCSNHLDDR